MFEFVFGDCLSNNTDCATEPLQIPLLQELAQLASRIIFSSLYINCSKNSLHESSDRIATSFSVRQTPKILNHMMFFGPKIRHPEPSLGRWPPSLILVKRNRCQIYCKPTPAAEITEKKRTIAVYQDGIASQHRLRHLHHAIWRWGPEHSKLIR